MHAKPARLGIRSTKEATRIRFCWLCFILSGASLPEFLLISKKMPQLVPLLGTDAIANENDNYTKDIYIRKMRNCLTNICWYITFVTFVTCCTAWPTCTVPMYKTILFRFWDSSFWAFSAPVKCHEHFHYIPLLAQCWIEFLGLVRGKYNIMAWLVD